MKNIKLLRRERRKKRIRKDISGTSNVPRLTVFKSAKHVYAQLIDDIRGVTLVAASTLSKGLKGEKGNVIGAKKVGEAIAEKAIQKGITRVVFDRNGYRYHGSVKALADAAREKGLNF